MRYLDKYPNCIGCPVKKFCGTMVERNTVSELIGTAMKQQL